MALFRTVSILAARSGRQLAAAALKAKAGEPADGYI
jgi:hypothetical protein